MKTFTDDLLLTIDRVSNYFKPVDSLITKIAEKIAPQITAQAGCNPPAGYDYDCGTNCLTPDQNPCAPNPARLRRFAISWSLCNVPGLYVDCWEYQCC